MINILIRSHRPHMLQECLKSVEAQTYTDRNVIINLNKGGMRGYTYNLLCNDLKEQVTDGWFFFLDDDDTLFDVDSLERISAHLTDPETAVICQFVRAGWKKPSDDFIKMEAIVPGHIGLPCLFLHHSKKHISDIVDTEDGDFLWIKAVASKMPVKFVQLIVVNSPKRNYGV